MMFVVAMFPERANAGFQNLSSSGTGPPTNANSIDGVMGWVGDPPWQPGSPVTLGPVL